MAVTNAISGIIVLGGLFQLSGPLNSPTTILAIAAVFFASINIVGGFKVTHRMLNMFKR
jgi:NAD(P) transhydrogenase subunit alpha